MTEEDYQAIKNITIGWFGIVTIIVVGGLLGLY